MVFLVILIVSFLAQLILPWWAIIIVSFATCGLIGKTGKISFWQPFLAIVALWVVMAIYKSAPNHHILAIRVANMLGVKYWGALLSITAFLGGLVAGISGICGHHFRKAILGLKAKSL